MMTKAALFVEMEPRHTNIEAIEMSSPLSTGFGLTGVFYKLHELLPVIIHADGGGAWRIWGGITSVFKRTEVDWVRQNY